MNRFYEIMKKHPDAKLLDIVTNRRSDYEPDALDAAQQVLDERGVKWELPQEQFKDYEPIENLRDEIAQRLAAGENIEQIKSQLKEEKGIDVFEYAEREQEAEEKINPDFAAKRRYYGGVGASMLLVMFAGLRFARRAPVLGVAVVVGSLVVGGVLLLVRKK